jgi:hypothetical protein
VDGMRLVRFFNGFGMAVDETDGQLGCVGWFALQDLTIF